MLRPVLMSGEMGEVWDKGEATGDKNRRTRGLFPDPFVASHPQIN